MKEDRPGICPAPASVCSCDKGAVDDGELRTFETGATRDTAEGKLDYEAFLSSPVLVRYAEYMHKCRHQSDGTLRDGDNWQKGMLRSAFMKSAWRHFMTWWSIHRGKEVDGVQMRLRRAVLEEALCALLFNVMGYLHEVLLDRSV